MSTIHHNTIVVGVNGSTESRAAVEYALTEGRRLGSHLRLVHVVPSTSVIAYAPMMVVPLPAELDQRAHSIIERAASQAREHAGGLFVEAEVAHGPRAQALVEAAKDARMLMVGRDSRSALDRMLLGDTMAGVACRADCPVVSVPAGWQPTDGTAPVVVGVKSLDHSDVLLEDAFATASDLGAPLEVLHAWRLPSAYDDIIATRVGEPRWDERDTRELDELIAPHAARHPEVRVTTKVTHDYAAHALEQASRHAGLLVLARRAHGFPAATHLGGTARHVLRTAVCPVRVIAPRHHSAVRVEGSVDHGDAG